jgi:hypothetical protein
MPSGRCFNIGGPTTWVTVVPTDVGATDILEKRPYFGSSLLDPDLNCFKLVGNLENTYWNGFLLG